MPESIEFDPTDKGTLRPNVPSLQDHRTKFIPIECPDFELQITLPHHVSSDDLITLFTLYYTKELISSIVRYTNNLPREAQDPTKQKARANK